MVPDDSPTTEPEGFTVSKQEVQLLAAAESRAKSEGVCYLRFSARDDGGVTVTEETDHVQALEEQANGE